jgi:hypothetical protein
MASAQRTRDEVRQGGMMTSKGLGVGERTGAAAVVARGRVAAGSLDGHADVVAHDHRDVVPILAAAAKVELSQGPAAPARLEVAACRTPTTARSASASPSPGCIWIPTWGHNKVAARERTTAVADLAALAAAQVARHLRGCVFVDEAHRWVREGEREWG